MLKLLLTLILINIAYPSFCLEKWQGKIYKENGVTVVENKGKGIWGEKISEKILFKETLSLGVEDGDENLIFGDRLGVVVDSEQNIYILDSNNFRILKFSKTGKFLWKIGRKGQGPGEFERSYKVRITNANNIAVLDNFLKIHFFKPDGNYLHSLKFEKMISHVEFLRDGRILLCPFTTDKLGYAPEFWSKDGKLLHKFSDKYFYGPKLPTMVGIMTGLTISKNRIFLCLPDKYEIREYNLKGELLRKFRREFPLKGAEIKVREGRIDIRV